jgi:phosphoglycolate phosphatase-like HAD superfamily hydrolase
VYWIEVRTPTVRLGQVRHALFDFDGTISVIRRGWENVMIPMMVEMICDEHPATPEIEAEVAEYVDRSTGVLTIEQMRWLEEAVIRYGFARKPLSAREYKAIYNERLLKPVRQRLAQMDGTAEARETLAIAGARAFLQDLHDRGVRLYLASGTDHVYVAEETAVLGVSDLFGDDIYGAMDDTEEYSKERIMQRILDDHGLHGEELLVVGDGPVEIREAAQRGAIALGLAADEEQRYGLNSHKRERLINAGADLIITDFMHHETLAEWLTAS